MNSALQEATQIDANLLVFMRWMLFLNTARLPLCTTTEESHTGAQSTQLMQTDAAWTIARSSAQAGTCCSALFHAECGRAVKHADTSLDGCR